MKRRSKMNWEDLNAIIFFVIMIALSMAMIF